VAKALKISYLDGASSSGRRCVHLASNRTRSLRTRRFLGEPLAHLTTSACGAPVFILAVNHLACISASD
jgi:hypothetical protein